MSETSVVDLGTKLGHAITVFRKRGCQMYYKDDGNAIPPNACLGLDLKDDYRKDVEGQGYRFEACDVTADGVLEGLPEADFYLAWDFLEHLPSRDWSKAVFTAMLYKARRGVWLKMPSFEPDEETGEGVLRKHGLRFAWTHWRGHPSAFQLQDVAQVLSSFREETGRDPGVRQKPTKDVRNSWDDCVVPVDAPIDTVKYTTGLGDRPRVEFDPPVIGQWQIIVTL